MKKALCICIVTILAAFCMGCQVTPEEPVVVQKDMEQMIQKGVANSETPVQESPPEISEELVSYAELCAHYGVPERFQMTITERDLTVNCDVAIELPDTLTLPMARVAAAKYPQDQVYALFGALCGDTPMYIVPDTLDKASYEQELVEWQGILAKATDENVIKSVNRTIDELEQLCQTAPDSIDLVPADGTLQTRQISYEETDAVSGSQQYLEATSDPYDAHYMYTAANIPKAMRFIISNDMDYEKADVYSFQDEQGNTQIIAPSSGSAIIFDRAINACGFGLGGTKLADVTRMSLEGGVVDGCLLKTTPQQARGIVEQLMADTGMDDMMIDQVTLYSSKEDIPQRIIDEKREQGFAPPEAPETQAFTFRLLRKVNGVKVESTHDMSETSISEASYGKSWYYEMLLISVDDEGIANLYWTGPLQITEILTENAALKPWGDIEGIFEKMIVINYADYLDHVAGLTIDIGHVSLSLQRIMQRDSFTTGLLVPVWNFYGTLTMLEKDGTSHVDDMGYIPMLSINAIDGSVIDPVQGY